MASGKNYYTSEPPSQRKKERKRSSDIAWALLVHDVLPSFLDGRLSTPAEASGTAHPGPEREEYSIRSHEENSVARRERKQIDCHDGIDHGYVFRFLKFTLEARAHPKRVDCIGVDF